MLQSVLEGKVPARKAQCRLIFEVRSSCRVVGNSSSLRLAGLLM